MKRVERMHESARRLLSAMEAINPGDGSTAAAARRLNIGDNLVTNWKERGVSVKGAVLAESELGIPASWIMSGRMPPVADRWIKQIGHESVVRLKALSLHPSGSAPSLTPDEQTLLSAFRQLGERERQYLLADAKKYLGWGRCEPPRGRIE